MAITIWMSVDWEKKEEKKEKKRIGDSEPGLSKLMILNKMPE